MINVISLYSDRSGCGDYRVRFPAVAVNHRSHEIGVSVEPSDHLSADATFDGATYNIRHIAVPSGVQVISFQRPTTAAIATAMEWLKTHRPDVGLVVELDDDLAGVPTSNVVYHAIHGNLSPTEGLKWLRRSLACADVLTVSTPELAKRYGTPGRPAYVVRNAVPESMLDQAPSNALLYRSGSSANSDRILGWAGSVETHRGDLESTCNALSEFVGADRTDGREVCFRNVGPKDGVAQALGLNESDVQASGWLKPHEYRVALGSMDIGIVPLADTRFNTSKSSIKGLEMLAAGVPVIASRVPEYVELQKSGAPIWLVKNTRREWTGALRRILALTDGELKDLAETGREYIKRYGTVPARADDWAKAWTAAARIAGRRVSVNRVR